MDQKYGEFVGVDKLYAAIVLEDSEDSYIADTPEYFAPAAEISGEPEIENSTTYYDNVAANNYVTEGKTTLTIIVSGVPADVAAKYLGKKYDASSGRVYDSGDPNPPDVALAFRFNKGKAGYRYYQYLKGTFSGGTEEAATKTSTIDIKTYQMTFTAVSTTHKWEIDGEMKPIKRIFGDTADVAFDPAGWFDVVQTPDTASAPDALTLVSSNPADDATGVVITSDITLTFSNTIQSYTIALLDDVYAPVAVEVSKNSTGKVVTVSPVGDLDPDTEYLLFVTEIKDIYNQKIVNTVIKFKTVA
jgi:phi13 family phage major tail protein